MAQEDILQDEALVGELITKGQFKAAMLRLTKLVRAALEAHGTHINTHLGKIRDDLPGMIKPLVPAPVKGDKGDEPSDERLIKLIKPLILPAMKGDRPSQDELLALIQPLIPPPVKGDPGPAPDHEAIAARAAELALPMAVGTIIERMPELGISIRESLRQLPAGKRVGLDTLEGFEEYLIEFMKKRGYNDMGGAAIGVMQSGALKVQTAQTLDFGGAGAPTVAHDEQGVTRLTFAAAGVTRLTATQTPNGSTTAFTFSSATAQPSYIVADNVWLRATTAAGTVNWTWNSGTKQATLTIAPQDEIYAIV